ncbi:hypothetical protein PP1Y_Lpl1865 (plasmid) [Novosphingobium sp. PP1Y]|nr:hypothetical protein PP1Y_Lpl1865 [Novosphingobium sp. PP1Y]
MNRWLPAPLAGSQLWWAFFWDEAVVRERAQERRVSDKAAVHTAWASDQITTLAGIGTNVRTCVNWTNGGPL